METLFDKLISYENLEIAFEKAKKGKSGKIYIYLFKHELEKNLLQLQNELLTNTYSPKPLETFIIRDPKTRKINKSDFRDRVVHHALNNVIEPIFEKSFIFDSYANRKGKGALKAIQRFDCFKRKVSKNNKEHCYVLKADIKHYFEEVNHQILLQILKKKIEDERISHLIEIILNNYMAKEGGKGMPLGNLTSQFFANVYLNELDQFVKHTLKVKCYIRYVDDFVIPHNSKTQLIQWEEGINNFLKTNLKLELHKDKTKILNLKRGINFLGYKLFYYHKLIRKKNIRHFDKKLVKIIDSYQRDIIDKEKALNHLNGWLSFISHANTHRYRTNLIKNFNERLSLSLSLHQIISHQK